MGKIALREFASNEEIFRRIGEISAIWRSEEQICGSARRFDG